MRFDLICIVLGVLLFGNCTKQKCTEIFGKDYNSIRIKYGSPIIHEYMQNVICEDSFQRWITPLPVQDTITIGYHAGKGMYVHPDSVLQEDDIFRKRINDSLYLFVGILTYGNIHKVEFKCIYDTVCAKSIDLNNYGKMCPSFNTKINDISIDVADSILKAWGTSRH